MIEKGWHVAGWFIPYQQGRIDAVHCFLAIGKMSTPLRVSLDTAVFPDNDHNLESRSFNWRYAVHGDDMRIVTATFDPISMDYFQKMKYGSAKVHVAHGFVRGQFDFPLAAEKVEEMMHIMRRVTERYLSAVAGVLEKPKGE